LFGGALDASSYHHVALPCLHMSGTKDDGPVFRITPEERRFSFHHTRAREQYYTLIEEAHHFTFGDNIRWNGELVTRDPAHHALIQKLTTIFWDAYLLRSEAAMRWLRLEAPTSLGESAVFESK
jgi:hypothetical protein